MYGHLSLSTSHEILDMARPFPLYFNNAVNISEKLLKLSLRRLGFGECEVIKPYLPSVKWTNFQAGFHMYYATRTSDVKSAYWQMRGCEETAGLHRKQPQESGLWGKIKRRMYP